MVYVWFYFSCDCHGNYLKRLRRCDVLSGGCFFDKGHVWQKAFKSEKVAFKLVSKLLKNFPVVHMHSSHYKPMEFISRGSSCVSDEDEEVAGAEDGVSDAENA